jgi:hypothetical protein
MAGDTSRRDDDQPAGEHHCGSSGSRHRGTHRGTTRARIPVLPGSSAPKVAAPDDALDEPAATFEHRITGDGPSPGPFQGAREGSHRAGANRVRM